MIARQFTIARSKKKILGVLGVSLLSSLLLASGQAGAQEQKPTSTPKPFIQLDKSRFADNENIFFWIGVRGETNQKPIPEALRKTCRLTIMRPDGTIKREQVSWPIDGPDGATWTGGYGLSERAVPGKYILVFEFGGKASAPTTLLVEHVDLVDNIRAEFVYGATEAGDTPVILTVHNDTKQTLRFPHRDGMNGMVWVRISSVDGKGDFSSFYPADKLLDADEPKAPTNGFDLFTWELAQSMPTITLKPGANYQQKLSLKAAVAEIQKHGTVPPGHYTVRFGTLLQVLVGETKADLNAFSPFRIPVETSATCEVTAP